MKQDDFAKHLARSIMTDGMSAGWRFGTICAQNAEVRKLVLKELKVNSAEQLIEKLAGDNHG